MTKILMASMEVTGETEGFVLLSGSLSTLMFRDDFNQLKKGDYVLVTVEKVIHVE